MADSNRAQVYYLAEVTWGATPASALTALRFTGESLKYNIKKDTSKEIRSDRQITDLIPTGADAGGGVNGELSYGTYDSFLAAALWSAGWSTPIAITGTIACDGTQNALVSATETMNTNVHTGQWILISDHSVGTYNVYALVTAATATHLILAGGITLATSAGEACSVSSSGMIRNGTTETSFTLERYHADVTQYFVYTGMVVNTFNLNVNSNAVIDLSFDFIGKDETLQQTSAGTGAASAANTNEVINVATHVGSILEGSTLAAINASLFIQKINLTVNNNVRGLDGIGNLANVDIGVGSCDVSGSMSPYFISETLYDKFVANTATGLSWKMQDTAGNAFIVTLHTVKYKDDSVNAGGQNSDVPENITFQALRNSTYDCTIQIDRFAA